LTRLLLASGLVAACGVLSGCGGPAEDLVPVTGQVTLDGKPLKVGSVSFRPDAARGNTSLHHPTSEIDAEGSYTLVSAGKKGAPPSWYRVLVFADENVQPGTPAHPVAPRWLVPAHYTDEKTTPLSVEVVAGPAEGAYDLKLKK
jgi:hypothetical protein